MQSTEDNAVAAFNARFDRVHTDEAKAERAAERAAYETRYEAMMARKRAKRAESVSNEDLRTKLTMVRERLQGADLENPTSHQRFLFSMEEEICAELNRRNADLG